MHFRVAVMYKVRILLHTSLKKQEIPQHYCPQRSVGGVKLFLWNDFAKGEKLFSDFMGLLSIINTMKQPVPHAHTVCFMFAIVYTHMFKYVQYRSNLLFSFLKEFFLKETL